MMSELVLQSSRFLNWKKEVESQGIQLENVQVIGEIRRNGKLLTALVDSQMNTSEGTTMPRFILLQNSGVVIIPVLTCQEDGKLYTLMVEQRRAIDGKWSMEFPSGGFEPQKEQPIVVAMQEIEEELGMQIDEKQLQVLNLEPLNTVPGSSSARLHYYYFEQEVCKSFLDEIDGRKTGCYDDHEYLTVHVQKMSEVSKTNCNIFIIAGIKLLEQKLNRKF